MPSSSNRARTGPVARPETEAEPSGLIEAAQAVLKAQADFKTWAEAGVMRGLLPYTEADLRRASLAAFDSLRAAVAKATGQ